MTRPPRSGVLPRDSAVSGASGAPQPAPDPGDRRNRQSPQARQRHAAGLAASPPGKRARRTARRAARRPAAPAWRRRPARGARRSGSNRLSQRGASGRSSRRSRSTEAGGRRSRKQPPPHRQRRPAQSDVFDPPALDRCAVGATRMPLAAGAMDRLGAQRRIRRDHPLHQHRQHQPVRVANLELTPPALELARAAPLREGRPVVAIQGVIRPTPSPVHVSYVPKVRAHAALPFNHRRQRSIAAHSGQPPQPDAQTGPCVGGAPTQQSTPPRCSTRPDGGAERGMLPAPGALDLDASSRAIAFKAFARSPALLVRCASASSNRIFSAGAVSATLPPQDSAPPSIQKRTNRAPLACGRCVQRPPGSWGHYSRRLPGLDCRSFLLFVCFARCCPGSEGKRAAVPEALSRFGHNAF